MWNCVKHVFWVKKVVGKIFFFKNWNFYPKGGSELVSFWKIGLKNVFEFCRLLPYMGIRTCKNLWKMGLKLFFAFFGFNQCEIVWNKFLSKKSFRKKFFQILKFLPYKGIRTCKNFWKMGLKNVFEFCRLSPYMGIRTCKHVWKMWLKNVFAFFRLLPYLGIRTCKKFWKMGLKFFFAFFRH